MPSVLLLWRFASDQTFQNPVICTVCMYDLRIGEGGRDAGHFSPQRCIGIKKMQIYKAPQLETICDDTSQREINVLNVKTSRDQMSHMSLWTRGYTSTEQYVPYFVTSSFKNITKQKVLGTNILRSASRKLFFYTSPIGWHVSASIIRPIGYNASISIFQTIACISFYPSVYWGSRILIFPRSAKA
jgi:hypothetical protein